MKILLDQFIADAIKIRHHLHRIPELQYEERKTGAFIASTLRSYGYEIQEGIGKTGIVAVLDSGKPGKILCSDSTEKSFAFFNYFLVTCLGQRAFFLSNRLSTPFY